MNPGLTFEQIEALTVRVNDHEEAVESPCGYAQRLQRLLPNFPRDVIVQWFFEHRLTILQDSWLPYRNLCFKKIELLNSELSRSDFSTDPLVEYYEERITAGNPDERLARIHQFFVQNKTWPVPPLVLYNPGNTVVAPQGMQCDSPYHLLEGRHRLAVLRTLRSAQLNESHTLWLATMEE
ncbi:MAG TPA: hypothetical protein VFE33_22295 [Thermoanaerobaculia bacterium]|nr:hypothetical protein [Thermoanaerobaculia bacterium]